MSIIWRLRRPVLEKAAISSQLRNRSRDVFAGKIHAFIRFAPPVLHFVIALRRKG
jgi:hypothetical protein